MASQTFEDYLHAVYSSKKSNAANSYIQAISILEDRALIASISNGYPIGAAMWGWKNALAPG